MPERDHCLTRRCLPDTSSDTSSDPVAPLSPHVHFGGTHTCPQSRSEMAFEIEDKLTFLLKNQASLPAEDRMEMLQEIHSLEHDYSVRCGGDAAVVKQPKPSPGKPKRDERELQQVLASAEAFGTRALGSHVSFLFRCVEGGPFRPFRANGGWW